MVIAADIRGKEEYRNFIYEILKRIISQHPDHSFLLICDQHYKSSINFSKNVTAIVGKQTKFSLLNDHSISSLLKKYKADVFLTAQTLSYIKVPQCLIAWDKFTLKYLKKAKVVIAASDFFRKEIIEKYKIDANKVDVVYKGVDEIFRPILFADKEIIKEQYSDGNEYFLATVTVQSQNHVMNLLKAFSVFKKMQKSNMQLLIHTQTKVGKEISETLRLFKFKSDVKILRNIDNKELAGITGAAYAFISPFAKDDYSQILEAMKCDVPVITGNVGAMPEVASDAALYVSSHAHKDIADKMMLIYKDEKLRQQLLEKGREQVKKYSWSNVAEMLWVGILKK